MGHTQNGGAWREFHTEIRTESGSTMAFQSKENVFNSIKIGEWYKFEYHDLSLLSATPIQSPKKAEIEMP